MAITDAPPCALQSPIPMQGTAQHNEILGAAGIGTLPKASLRASCPSAKREVVQKWWGGGGHIFSPCIPSPETGCPAAGGRCKRHEEQGGLRYRAGVLR